MTWGTPSARKNHRANGYANFRQEEIAKNLR